MARISIKLSDIKRAGTWLTAICAIAYTAFSLLDIALHIHEGWSEGVRQRDMVIDAKLDCSTHRFASVPLQKQCAHINSTPVPIPWRIAMHHIGHHLRDKITSALRSIVMLIITLIPIASILFYCLYRHQNPSSYHPSTPTHQRVQEFLAGYLPAYIPESPREECRHRRRAVAGGTSGQVILDTSANPSSVVYDTSGASAFSTSIDTDRLDHHRRRRHHPQVNVDLHEQN